MSTDDGTSTPGSRGSRRPSGHDLTAWLYGIATLAAAGLGVYTLRSEPNRASENRPYIFIVVALFGSLTLYHGWKGSREAEARDVVGVPPPELSGDSGDALVLLGDPRVHQRLGLLALAVAPLMFFLLDGLKRGLALALAAFGAFGNLWRAWRTPRGPVVVIDRQGIRDARLKTGPIAWNDVERVYFQGLHGSTLLCLVLRNPRAVRGASRVGRWMGIGDVQVSLVGLYPGAYEVRAVLERLRPDCFSQDI